MGSVVSTDLDPCLVQLHEISPTVLLESKQTNRVKTTMMWVEPTAYLSTLT